MHCEQVCLKIDFHPRSISDPDNVAIDPAIEPDQPWDPPRVAGLTNKHSEIMCGKPIRDDGRREARPLKIRRRKLDIDRLQIATLGCA